MNLEILYVVAPIVGIFVLLIMPMYMIRTLYNKPFGGRMDSKENIYDYVKNQRPDFDRKEVSFLSNKGQQLTGYFYPPCRQAKGLVIFAHGMGCGHEAYLAEISYLVAHDYLVFTYDGTGVQSSTGKNMIGLPQAPIDLKHAIDYLATVKELEGYATMLYGHSWGGYAVSSVHCFPLAIEIKGVVSSGGFQKTENVLKQHGKKVLGKRVNLFTPYIALYEAMLFGMGIGKVTGINGLSKTTAKVMITHSRGDYVVDYGDNYLAYYNQFCDNPRFTFLSIDNHCHNIQMIESSYNRIHEIKRQQRKMDERSPDYANLTAESLSLCLDVDETTMTKVIEFYDSLV